MRKHEEYARSRNPYYALVHAKSIDSRVINVFKDTFDVTVGNIGFQFVFIDDKREESCSVVEKMEGEKVCIFKVSVYNLNTGKVQGSFRPLSFGEMDGDTYHFSLTGIAREGGKDKIVVFNLFKEPKDGQN
jgi:hypothetical protein